MNTTTMPTLAPLLSKGGDHTLMKDVVEAFTKYLWMFMCLFGLFGNTLTAVISLQKHSRKLSPCVYMTGLSFADSMVLLTNVWTMPLLYYVPEAPAELSLRSNDDMGEERVALSADRTIQSNGARPVVSALCLGGHFTYRFAFYQGYAFGTLSGFYLAEMTIDRLVAVRFPMLVPRICTTKRARITVAITFVILVSLNLYILFRYTFVVDENTGEEGSSVSQVVTGQIVTRRGDLLKTSFMRLSVPEAPIFEILGTVFQLAVGTFLPFLMIVICNVWIIVTLRSAAKRSDKLGVREDAQKIRQKETTYLTRMLIFVSVAYVITSIPFRLYNILYDVNEIRQKYDFREEYWVVRQNLEHYTLAHFWNWNYAINFYLYCVGGGKKYRNEVKVILKKMFCCGK